MNALGTHASWTSYPTPDNLPPVVVHDPALPLISIVTPSYNQGRYIQKTIESVLGQNYPNVEYWVIDGGSTDETLSLLQAYAHDPRMHWISEPDDGQSDAINKGWSRCRGDIIAWLNSDDYYMPDIFHTIAAHFAADKSVDLAFGHIHYITSDERLLNVETYAVSPEHMLTSLVLPAQPACFLRRSAVLRAGALNPNLHYMMDADLLLKVMSNGRFCHIPDVLVRFRVHQDAKSHRVPARFADDAMHILRTILQQRAAYPALQSVSDEQLRCRFYRWASRFLYMGNDFKQSLRYMLFAASADRSAWFSILAHEWGRWLVRWSVPTRAYLLMAAHFHTVRRKLQEQGAGGGKQQREWS